MNNGWIKLHRKILDNPLAKKPTWAWLWVTLLLLANHDETNKFIWNGKEIIQKKGQFITGRKKLNEITGIPETTIERCLNYLESGHQIEQQKTTKYRLITIVKWESYQSKDNKADNRRTTDGQQTDTIKNLKKERSKEEDTPSGEAEEKPKTFLQGKQWNELIDSFSEVNPMYTQFYSLPHQRKALDELAKTLGFDKLKNTIQALAKITSQPYAPKITSPIELKRDLGKLVAFYNQEKTKKEGVGLNKRGVIW